MQMCIRDRILGAHERLITLEHRLFSELLESISAQLDRIQRTANAVAQLDEMCIRDSSSAASCSRRPAGALSSVKRTPYRKL